MTLKSHEWLPQSLLETAAFWHDRMQREKATDEARRELGVWLAASPAHAEAYATVERTWSALREHAEAPPILALRHETALRLSRRASSSVSAVRAVAAVFVLTAIGVGVLAWLTPGALPQAITVWVRNWLPGESHYATTTGERLTATLRDGSQVTLDTESELEIAFTKAERLVHLKRGQAFFEVAKDKTRPFVVQVNDRRLVAVGTAFDVRLDGGQIRVTMVEGTVRVERADGGRDSIAEHAAPGAPGPVAAGASGGTTFEPSTPAPKNTEVISAGEQLWVDQESRDHVGTADPERATSWRRGQLIFDAVRLGDAVAEINRYSETKIRLADAALADVRISGSFATGRTSGFVEAVTSYFPIDVAESSDRSVVLKARQ